MSSEKYATVLVREEFEQKYPLSHYEIYPLEALDRYRKSLGGDDAEAVFKANTSDLEHLLVWCDSKAQIIFVRKKSDRD